MTDQTVRYPIKLEQGQLSLSFSFDGQVRKYTWDSSRHCNAEYELHVILKGASAVDVEETQHRIEEKQAILIAPGMYHKPHISTPDFERFSLGFSLSEGPVLAALKAKVPQSLCFYPSGEFLGYCNLFIRECAYRHPMKQQALKALATLLTIALLRDLQLIHSTDSVVSNETERIAVIDNFFEKQFARKNGCALLAEQLHLSTRQLNRYLKDSYGMGYQEKLIQTRMDQTALLLRSTNKSIQDIMEFVGYSSVTAFYKAFGSKFAMTPQQYRKQNSQVNGNP